MKDFIVQFYVAAREVGKAGLAFGLTAGTAQFVGVGPWTSLLMGGGGAALTLWSGIRKLKRQGPPSHTSKHSFG